MLCKKIFGKKIDLFGIFIDMTKEVLWKTLGSLEFDNDREVDDVEEFFKYMNKKVFNDKIKQGYLNFKK
jgi:hypothetical protein